MAEESGERAGNATRARLDSGVYAEGPVERIFKWASEAALIIMLCVVGVDIVSRSIFNFSFEIADELSGYMLVAITFLSLSVCQVNDSFHRVELIQARLSPHARAVSRVAFDCLSLAFAGLLLWHFTQLEITSWRFDERAPTYLETQLWIPRMTMALGVMALCFSICRTLAAHLREARRLGAAGRRSREP